MMIWCSITAHDKQLFPCVELNRCIVLQRISPSVTLRNLHQKRPSAMLYKLTGLEQLPIDYLPTMERKKLTKWLFTLLFKWSLNQFSLCPRQKPSIMIHILQQSEPRATVYHTSVTLLHVHQKHLSCVVVDNCRHCDNAADLSCCSGRYAVSHCAEWEIRQWPGIVWQQCHQTPPSYCSVPSRTVHHLHLLHQHHTPSHAVLTDCFRTADSRLSPHHREKYIHTYIHLICSKKTLKQ